jgi:hypothetical protein
VHQVQDVDLSIVALCQRDPVMQRLPAILGRIGDNQYVLEIFHGIHPCLNTLDLWNQLYVLFQFNVICT